MKFSFPRPKNCARFSVENFLQGRLKMTYTKDESLTNFEFWSGAADRAKLLTYSELEQLDNIVPDLFADTPTETQINDLFWFDFETICEMLGTTEDDVFAREKD